MLLVAKEAQNFNLTSIGSISSRVAEEIIGTQVIPEFPVNLMVIAAIGLMGALIALRLKDYSVSGMELSGITFSDVMIISSLPQMMLKPQVEEQTKHAHSNTEYKNTIAKLG